MKHFHEFYYILKEEKFELNRKMCTLDLFQKKNCIFHVIPMKVYSFVCLFNKKNRMWLLASMLTFLCGKVNLLRPTYLFLNISLILMVNFFEISKGGVSILCLKQEELNKILKMLHNTKCKRY